MFTCLPLGYHTQSYMTLIYLISILHKVINGNVGNLTASDLDGYDKYEDP